MAKPKKRRRGTGRKSRKERLKDNLYKAAIVGIVGDPEGTNPELQAMFDEAADKAVVGGVPVPQLKALVKKALADAKEIAPLVEEHDVLVKIVGQGWEIVPEGEA
jgi:hypothetical protein